MRTLVVSDLHLGSRLGRDVLRRPEPLDALLAALDGVDRLILLGDVVDRAMRRASRSRAFAAAEPVLRALGSRLASGAEVVLVPGNHEAPLVRPWFWAHRGPRTVDESIPLDASPDLARVASWLAPASVQLRYPGVWLAPRVWATHGHYLDRHLIPRASYGLAAGRLRHAPHDTALPADYDRRGRRFARRRGDGALARMLDGTLAATTQTAGRLLTPRLAPVTSSLLDTQARHAAVPALGRVAQRLGVDADWVVFGHVHRRGPLPADDAQRWTGAGGRPRIINTGAWVYEPRLVAGHGPEHPYWPGGAVLLEDGEEPRLVGLLDDVGADALR